MNKRFLSQITLLSSLIFLLSSSYAVAAEIESHGPLRKLQRGFVNVVMSPFEIANELHKEKKEDTFLPSWFAGAGRGIAYTAGRAVTGLYEMVTFPLPLPADYEPVIYPEFPWEHFPDDAQTTLVDADEVVSGTGALFFSDGRAINFCNAKN